mmetsp:Transcript_39795/g.59779  ORF Transcript_39795/g.59779 Transcript_39795/m.59779 type:complete len:92 (-) Transcript_39795:1030-1305(-)
MNINSLHLLCISIHKHILISSFFFKCFTTIYISTEKNNQSLNRQNKEQVLITMTKRTNTSKAVPFSIIPPPTTTFPSFSFTTIKPINQRKN